MTSRLAAKSYFTVPARSHLTISERPSPSPGLPPTASTGGPTASG